MIDEGVTPTAEREFERSIELNPRYAHSTPVFRMVSRDDGAFRGGLYGGEARLSFRSTLSPIRFAMGCVYWSAHRFDQAIVELEKAIELDPGNAYAHSVLGYTLMYKSLYERAIEELQKRTRVPSSWRAQIKDQFLRKAGLLPRLSKQAID